MDESGLAQLQKQIEANLGEFSTSAEQTIQNRSQILAATVKELIEQHSTQIRNLGLISGVVAPLSLTLLQIDQLNIFTPFLISGFILLLLNIFLSHFLLDQELGRKNTLTSRAILEFVSASINKMRLDDKKQDTSTRVMPMADFLKNIDDFDKFLNISPHSVEPIHAKKRLSDYSKMVISIFGLGCGLIILSLFWNSCIQWIVFLFARVG